MSQTSTDSDPKGYGVDQDQIIKLTTPAASSIPKIRKTHFSMAPKRRGSSMLFPVWSRQSRLEVLDRQHGGAH